MPLVSQRNYWEFHATNQFKGTILIRRWLAHHDRHTFTWIVVQNEDEEEEEEGGLAPQFANFPQALCVGARPVNGLGDEVRERTRFGERRSGGWCAVEQINMREARTLQTPAGPPPILRPSVSAACCARRPVVLSFLLPFAKHTIRAWTRRTTYARDCASYECPDRLVISVTSRVFRTERQRGPLYCKTPLPLSSSPRALSPLFLFLFSRFKHPLTLSAVSVLPSFPPFTYAPRFSANPWDASRRKFAAANASRVTPHQWLSNHIACTFWVIYVRTRSFSFSSCAFLFIPLDLPCTSSAVYVIAKFLWKQHGKNKIATTTWEKLAIFRIRWKPEEKFLSLAETSWRNTGEHWTILLVQLASETNGNDTEICITFRVFTLKSILSIIPRSERFSEEFATSLSSFGAHLFNGSLKRTHPYTQRQS